MLSLKRLLQVSVFAVCVMSSTVLFAVGAPAVTQPEVVASSPAEQPETPALPEEIDFGALFTPEPLNRSCTATSDCTPVGGVQKTCTGVTTCSSAANWVTCDNVITYCSCYAPGVPTCYNPTGFCACWEQYHNWASCRQGYCIEP
jgi:hypothetical protein